MRDLPVDFHLGTGEWVAGRDGVRFVETLAGMAMQSAMEIQRLVAGDREEPRPRSRVIEGPFRVRFQEGEPYLLDTVLAFRIRHPIPPDSPLQSGRDREAETGRVRIGTRKTTHDRLRVDRIYRAVHVAITRRVRRGSDLRCACVST